MLLNNKKDKLTIELYENSKLIDQYKCICSIGVSQEIIYKDKDRSVVTLKISNKSCIIKKSGIINYQVEHIENKKQEFDIKIIMHDKEFYQPTKIVTNKVKFSNNKLEIAYEKEGNKYLNIYKIGV